MADDYFKDQWPPLQQEWEVMEKGNTRLKKGKGKAKVRVSWRGEELEVKSTHTPQATAAT